MRHHWLPSPANFEWYLPGLRTQAWAFITLRREKQLRPVFQKYLSPPALPALYQLRHGGQSRNLQKNQNPGNKVIDIPKKYEKVPLYLKKGSMLSFHSNVIHGSYSNTSKDNWRPIVLMAYIKKGTDYQSGKTSKSIPIELR